MEIPVRRLIRSGKNSHTQPSDYVRTTIAEKKVATQKTVAIVRSKKSPKSEEKKGTVTANGSLETAAESNAGMIQQRFAYGSILEGYLYTDVESGETQGLGDRTKDIALNRIFRDIYYHDPVCGGSVDLMSNLPFSDFALGGAKDQKVYQKYEDSIQNCNTKQLHPILLNEYLVHGLFCATTLFDEKEGTMTGIVPQNIAYIDCLPVPIFGRDPIVTLQVGEAAKALKNYTGDERMKEYSDLISPKDTTSKPKPEDIIYIPRRALLRDIRGASIYKRVLTTWLVERTLYRGTLDQAMKRQKPITHMQIGDTEWTPTQEDMQQLVNALLSADLDPVGSIFATRTGVSISDVRSSGDLWKVSDLESWFTTAKLRSMGVSEAFLSGDANFNCVTGDTLIPTENGIFRIDELANLQDGNLQDINIKVDSRYSPETAVKWLYQGEAPVISVKTDKGNNITGTRKHKVLVFNNETGETEWCKLGKIQEDDLLCISTNIITRSHPLLLSLSPFSIDGVHKKVRHQVKDIIVPEIMTTELAFILGAIVSEGAVSKSTISIGNTDLDFLEKIKSLIKQVFNIEGVIDLKSKKGTPYSINNVKGVSTKDMYYLRISSIQLVHYLLELGHVESNDSTPSYKYEVPWSVLQADEESQLSFLAAYLEGDGSVTDRISYFSKSTTLCHQILAILNALGINAIMSKDSTRVELTVTDSRNLWELISKYMVTKTLIYGVSGEKARNRFGFPITYWKNLLDSRKIDSDRYGTRYRTDDNEVVTVSYNDLRGDKEANFANSVRFLYDIYDRGEYSGFLELLKAVSSNAYAKFMKMIETRYNLTEVISIEDAGIQKVYDLSIKAGQEPAYVANGLVTHNTMDQAMSVFIESMKAVRDMITYELYYDRMFPRIASANEYSRKRNAIAETAAFSKYQEREEDLYTLAFNRPYMAHYQQGGAIYGDQMDMFKETAALRRDTRDLFIPQVHWFKRLRPEADSEYLGVLAQLEEKNVPIPLRIWAAAGGLDLNSLLQQKQDDMNLREKVKEWLKVTRPAEEGGGGMDLSSVLTSKEFSAPAYSKNRDYSDIDSAPHNIAGGKRHIMSRKGERILTEKIHKQIAEVASDLSQRLNAIQKGLDRQFLEDNATKKIYT